MNSVAKYLGEGTSREPRMATSEALLFFALVARNPLKDIVWARMVIKMQ